MLFSAIRPLLFALDAETAHDLTLVGLRAAKTLHIPLACPPPRAACVELMGLLFPNRIGLAAGLDKNGECIDALAALGFGHIEIGTVTPRPQPGNPRPRLFRLPEQQAVINRMGFNNYGVDALVANVTRSRYKGILGINIGKNFDTPIENAVDDYLACLRKVYAHAGYVTINISSPNTKNLRQLQEGNELDNLLMHLEHEQETLSQRHGRRVPIALKIAPDLDEMQIRLMADSLRRHRIDAVIATNTTLARQGVEHLPHARESGGLSGAPLLARATDVLRSFSRHLQGEIPLIGVGGILNGKDARAKLEAGAQLVQLYTGLIYRGPSLIREAIKETREI